MSLSDSDDEWLRELCRSKRSPSPPDKWICDVIEARRRDNYSRAGERHGPATPQNDSPPACSHHDVATVAAFSAFAVRPARPAPAPYQRLVASAPEPLAAPRIVRSVASRVADRGAPRILRSVAPRVANDRGAPWVAAADGAREATPAASAPEAPAPTFVGPAPAPPGPLELPALVDDSSSESDEEAQRQADHEMKGGHLYESDTEQPSESMVLHLMHKRLKRADSKGGVIGTVYCRQVSFNATFDTVFPWAVRIIDELRSSGSSAGSAFPGLTRFKVGITHNPARRWLHRDYGYRGEDWGYMHVLWVTRPGKAADLERTLISHYKRTQAPGMYNINPGGESCPRVAPVFVYAVFGFNRRLC